MMVNNLNELAFKNGLWDHKIDPEIIKELDDLENQRNETLERLDKL